MLITILLYELYSVGVLQVMNGWIMINFALTLLCLCTTNLIFIVCIHTMYICVNNRVWSYPMRGKKKKKKDGIFFLKLKIFFYLDLPLVGMILKQKFISFQNKFY